MATKTATLHATLVSAFRKAKEAAIAAGQNTEDGGTCNMDSPAFRIERCPDKVIQKAAKEAGVCASSFHWFSGKRWYWLTGFLNGQGSLRSRMSHAAHKSLSESLRDVPGASTCEYLQCD